MTIKKQLRAFYADQGLTGKHLRKALRYDMKAVRRHVATQQRPPCNNLQNAFGWGRTPEGAEYWAHREIGVNFGSRKVRL